MKENSFLYQFLGSVFCIVVLIANIISAKMVPIGNYLLPAGLLFYPLTFLLSDLVTELFGATKARRMIFVTIAMNLVAWLLIQIALLLPSHSAEVHQQFHAILGLSGLRIFASLTAFTIAQLIDIQLYALIKRWTGLRYLWVRSNGSTWFSQAVDTCVVDLIYLFGGIGMPLGQVFSIILFSLAYKVIFSLLATPLFYLAVYLLRSRRTLKIPSV